MNYLSILFDKEICKRIEYLYKDKTQIIIKQYPCVERDGKSYMEQYEQDYAKILKCIYQLRLRQIDHIKNQEEVGTMFET